MSTSASTVTNDNREKVIFTYWLYPAIGIPFVILGLWGGFGVAFQSGAASAFMCGTIIAALGECLFENWKDGFTSFKAMIKTPGKDRAAAIFGVVLATAFFFLNMYFAVADKNAPHPAVDWIQVTVFIVTALFLPQARFAFTTKLPTVTGITQSSWDYGYRFGYKIGRHKGAHGGPPVPEVGGDVLPPPAEVQGNAPVPPSTKP